MKQYYLKSDGRPVTSLGNKIGRTIKLDLGYNFYLIPLTKGESVNSSKTHHLQVIQDNQLVDDLSKR